MRVRGAAVAFVLAALVTGCGGGGGEEAEQADEVTTEEFCESYLAVEETEGFAETREGIAELAERGLPEQVTEEAATGFGRLVDLAAEARTNEEAQRLAGEIGPQGQKEIREFFMWATETCQPDLTSEPPTEDPTE